MPFDAAGMAVAIRTRRLAAGLTQAELAERLNLSAQAVSHWECGDTLPDITLLLDLACMLGCSVDALLGSPGSMYRRRVTVDDVRRAIGCILRLRELLGAEHFMYRTMVDALDARMNSSIEAALVSDNAMDAYVCEAILACVEQGDWVDTTDVQRNIRNEKARSYALSKMQERGLK